MNKPNKIIIHHSGTDEGTFESIKRYHVESNGWQDIGYHYLITTDGKVYQGRKETAIGAHTRGENTNSIGICVVGNFEKQLPKQEQLTSLVTLIKDIRKRHGDLLLHGHKEFANTNCPGKHFPWETITKMLEEVLEKETSPWAVEAQQWVKKEGISDGERPKDLVTREELWTILHRVRG